MQPLPRDESHNRYILHLIDRKYASEYLVQICCKSSANRLQLGIAIVYISKLCVDRALSHFDYEMNTAAAVMSKQRDQSILGTGFILHNKKHLCRHKLAAPVISLELLQNCF